jgi:hypothetical protein
MIFLVEKYWLGLLVANLFHLLQKEVELDKKPWLLEKEFEE